MKVGDIVTSKINHLRPKYEIIKVKKTVCWVKLIDDGWDGDEPIYKNVSKKILEIIKEK